MDITPGSVSVMGLMNDHENNVRLLVDVPVGEYVGCHPCINTTSLKLRTEDVFGAFLEAVHHDYQVVHLGGQVNHRKRKWNSLLFKRRQKLLFFHRINRKKYINPRRLTAGLFFGGTDRTPIKSKLNSSFC